MASVKKFPGSQYWYVCYTLPGGKRKQTSSGLTDKHQALKVALSLEHAGMQAAKGTLTHRRVFGLVQEICAAADQPLQMQSVGPYVESWFATKARFVQPGTARKYTETLASLKKSWEDRWLDPLALIDTAAVLKWREDLVKTGIAMQTVNGKLTMGESCFGQAVTQGLLPQNPFAGTRLEGKIRRQSRKAFTWAQFAQLVEATEGEWRLLILVAGYTGQRQQMCTQLKWSSIDFAAAAIDFANPKAGKNNKSVRVPLHPALREPLTEAKKASHSPHVFPELSQVRTRGRNGISSSFREDVLPKVGINQPYHAKDGKKARSVAEYSFHSLRHFFVSQLNAAGVSEADRMKIVGHADRNINIGYTHTEWSQLTSAVEKLPTVR